MNLTVKEWVKQYCRDCDDATSLRIMRGRAIAGAAVECRLLEDVKGSLPVGDPWIPQITAERDRFLDYIEKLEARLKELGVPFGDERSYGVTAEDMKRVSEAREKRPANSLARSSQSRSSARRAGKGGRF